MQEGINHGEDKVPSAAEPQLKLGLSPAKLAKTAKLRVQISFRPRAKNLRIWRKF